MFSVFTGKNNEDNKNAKALIKYKALFETNDCLSSEQTIKYIRMINTLNYCYIHELLYLFHMWYML